MMYHKQISLSIGALQKQGKTTLTLDCKISKIARQAEHSASCERECDRDWNEKQLKYDVSLV